MIDERKVKLMTRMAFYEENEGKKDLKISGYYRKDYVSLHVLFSIIWVTIGYISLVAMIGICMFDQILASLSVAMVITLGTLAVIGYLAVVILYAVYTHVYCSKKHQKARMRVKKYNHDLARLLKIYERENK